MKIVTLVSGGLDSSLMAVLIKEMNYEQFPLFINYGQLAFQKEWEACQKIHKDFNLSKPYLLDISNYGKTISSGITDINKNIKIDAFLPGRNFLFILLAAAYAYQLNANCISIGLLNEKTILFPDQSNLFLIEAERLIEISMNKQITIITPLRDFYKKDIVALAQKKGIIGTYSCHAGANIPCGKCISCEEFKF